MNLSTNESAILRVLWATDRPLTRREILDLCPSLTCQKRTAFVLLNNLQQKGLIKVTGHICDGKRHARLFEPCMSQAAFLASTISDQLPNRNIPNLSRYYNAKWLKRPPRNKAKIHIRQFVVCGFCV